MAWRRLRRDWLVAVVVAVVAGVATASDSRAADMLVRLPPISAVSAEPDPLPPATPTSPRSWLDEDPIYSYSSSYKACGVYCPCVYGGVDYLYLRRSGDIDSIPLLVDNNTGDTLVNASRFGFDHMSAARAWFGLGCGHFGAVEFGFLGLIDSNSSFLVTQEDFPGAVLTLPGDLGPASNVFFGTDRLRFNYNSRVNSYEINWATCCNRECTGACSQPAIGSVEWLAGFRYIPIRENLDIFGERAEGNAIETGTYHISASNNLYGFQIGTRLRKHWGVISTEAVAKAGAYANDASQSQYLADFPDNFLLLGPVGASSTNVAFAGEINLSVIYQITTNWGLRAGYNVFLIDGVALAPNQADFTFTDDTGRTINQDSSILLHGFHIGIEARW